MGWQEVSYEERVCIKFMFFSLNFIGLNDLFEFFIGNAIYNKFNYRLYS